MRRMNRLAATVLVILAPMVVLFVLGGMTGAVGLGSPEIAFLNVVWAVGLGCVWWPRHWRKPR